MFKGDRLKKVIVLGLFALSLLTSSIVLADQLNTSDETSEDVSENENISRAQNVYQVKLGDYVERAAIRNAEVNFLRSDSVRILDNDGIFVEYLVENIQEVKEGDPIASYNIPVDTITIEEKKMNLARSEEGYSIGLEQREARLANLRNDLINHEDDSIDGKIIKINIEKEEIDLEQYINQSNKNLDNMKEEIKDLESNLQAKYVYAPYSGIVFFYDQVREGTAINRGTHLLEIIDINSVILSAPSTSNDKFWYNMDVSVTLITNRQEDTANVHKGKIIAADSLINGVVSTGTYYIQLDNARELLDFGQTANIYAEEIKVEDVIIIPSSAVNLDGVKRYVHILDEKGAIRKQYITGRDNGVDVWIYNGLEVGQQIIAD